MKSIIFYFAVIVAFILSTYSSNAKQVQIKLKVNEELIYEWTEKEVFFTEKGTSNIDQIKRVKYSLLIDKIENNKILFTAKVLRDVAEYPNDGTTVFKDYRYPQLVNYFWKDWNFEISEEVLNQTKFRFELDLNTRSIQLINRVEILEKCHSILSAKGYSEETRSNIIDKINKTDIQKQSNLFLVPLQFIDVNIDQAKIHSEKLGIDLSVVKRDEEQIELNSKADGQNNNINNIIDLRSGLQTYFNEESTRKVTGPIEMHSISYNFINAKVISTTRQLRLIQKSVVEPPTLIICGHIENPAGNQIVAYTLNNFIGSNLDSKSVYIEPNGNFRIDAKLMNNGLVVLTNPNKKQNIVSPLILLYAEPGDSIYLNAKFALKQIQSKFFVNNDSSSIVTRECVVAENIEFSGNHQNETELLKKILELSGLFPLQIRENQLFIEKRINNVNTILTTLSKLKQLKAASLKELNPESANFIERELQAYLYSLLFEAQPIEADFGGYINNRTLVLPNNLKNLVQSQLDTLNIQRIYNDYGIFSRNLTQNYVQYKFQHLLPTNRIKISLYRIGLIEDLEQYIQFNKLVLSGTPLYRELANQLYRHSLNTYNNAHNQFKWETLVDETFSLMIKRCNDEAFINSLKELKDNKLKWNSNTYIPENQFLTLQNKVTYLRSFISQKPTIIFSANNWSIGRYEMDDEVIKHPEINFVLIEEGSNFDLWKEWNDRAEPKAHQLFLLNDSLNLENIFLNNFRNYLIINNSGERIGIESDLDKAVSIAKKSLQPKKKEVNKSTLKGIIIFLSGFLLLFLLLFLVYKYRMKQRLKKQTQEKRLRELQMAAIRAQMNPHFLFNSLNSVQNLIQQNRAQEAHLYLSDFAGLIRKVLRNSDKEEVSLAEELETLEQYLNLEKLRFDFDYHIEVDELIDQNLFMLPSMILQPIAENSLIHGLQNKTGDKKLSIKINKEDNSVKIIIEDNGIGIEASKNLRTNSNGVGLKMNEERILMMKAKYSGNYSFKLIELSKYNQEGTRVEIIIPEEQ